MSTDATPSWSGYIFQGEVALCKALESINGLGGAIPDEYALKLEQNEDFSLTTNTEEVFQVKAYLSKDSDKISKYKGVIEELISKYYYTVTVVQDPTDRRRVIKTYGDVPRPEPIKCFLITDKVITDFVADLSNFDDKFRAARNDFSTIQGVYTINNISQKLHDAVKVNSPHLTDDDIAAKVSHCSFQISNLIKERHSTKAPRDIPFSEIQGWIDNSALSFTQDICWYEIVKMFLGYLTDEFNDYDLAVPEELAEYEKVNSIVAQLELLDHGDIVQLIKYYTTPHKGLDNSDLRGSFGNFLDSETVKSVILTAIKKITNPPTYKNLQYTKASAEGTQIRYQLLNHNVEFDESSVHKRRFQQHCEDFYKHPNTLDVDIFVTRHLSKSKEEIKLHLQHILTPEVDDSDNNSLFGFSTIADSIIEINS